MNVFSLYSSYYDLFYADKAYQAEADFITKLLVQYHIAKGDLLELGCGTGVHALCLAQKGYNVHGIDLSQSMLAKAKKRLSAEQENSVLGQVSFAQGDVRDYRNDRQYDAVLSLFHVVSYQTTNADLEKMFLTVRQHLKPGGIFIFDCWYGPAVLTARPAVRVKEFENDSISAKRTANPQMHVQENVVDVNYEITIRDKKTQRIEQINETHRMRYLFNPELEMLFQKVGLKYIEAGEWLTKASPSYQTWSVYFVCRG